MRELRIFVIFQLTSSTLSGHKGDGAQIQPIKAIFGYYRTKPVIQNSLK